MTLNEQFEAATQQVDKLPGDQAARYMTELYGLYKQATDGDVNMKHDEVDFDEADKADGPAGLSQAQWDSWNQYKGVPEDEAKRRYVARVREITGGDSQGSPAGKVPTDAGTGAPISDHAAGGLRGNIEAGTPYGGEDKLKEAQK